MFAGHLAVAVGTKRADPRLPLWSLVAAVFWLDLLWPLFLLIGIETVHVSPGDTAFTSLAFDHYPWSHSLAMSLAWGGLWMVGARALGRSWRDGLILGALVLSHWILDFVTHRPDLPLWPGGPLVGLGLWSSRAGTYAVEGGLYLGATWLYLRKSRPLDAVGRYALGALLVMVGVVWATQPFSPPPPSPAAVAWVGVSGWLFLPWAAWIDRHRASS
jgi:membrane-bound metal-dependent hydrolase YbcI (DUF457 family)